MKTKLPLRSILILIVLCFIFGWCLLQFQDYGQSWDEYRNYEPGIKALKAYRLTNFLKDQNDDYFHGTFYFMFFALVPEIANRIIPDVASADFGHLLNYLTFFLGVIAFYRLVKLASNADIALISTGLMALQPVIWGHAFINQKDIPFFTFFILSIYLGIKSVSDNPSSSNLRDKSGSQITLLHSLVGDFHRLPPIHRWSLVSILVIGALLSFELIFPVFFYPLFKNTLSNAYNNQSLPMINQFFHTIASDSWKTPLPMYLEKLQRWLYWLDLTAILFVACMIWIILRTRMERTYSEYIQPFLRKYGLVLLSGIVLGLTSAIRILGLFAGILVCIYLISVRKKDAPRKLVLYTVSAILAMYLVWPALWGNPILKLTSRAAETLEFETQTVVFRGEVIRSDELPRIYLPIVLAIQITEPALLLVPIGVYAIVRGRWKDERSKNIEVIMALWFLIPLTAQIVLKTPIYNNYRLFLFITPPIFFFSGIGCDWLLKQVRSDLLASFLTIAFLIPGIVHIIRFHPFEYVYYNQLVGGVAKAQNSYEMEYWCTSMRQAIEWINIHSNPEEKVIVYGPDVNTTTFGRKDLDFIRYWRPVEKPEYILSCEKFFDYRPHHPEFEIATRIERDGVSFSTVFLGSEN